MRPPFKPLLRHARRVRSRRVLVPLLLLPLVAGCAEVLDARLRVADHHFGGKLDPQGGLGATLAWHFRVPSGTVKVVWTEEQRFEAPLFVNLTREGVMQASRGSGFGDAAKESDAGKGWTALTQPRAGRWAYEVESGAPARVEVWLYVCATGDHREACRK